MKRDPYLELHMEKETKRLRKALSRHKALLREALPLLDTAVVGAPGLAKRIRAELGQGG